MKKIIILSLCLLLVPLIVQAQTTRTPHPHETFYGYYNAMFATLDGTEVPNNNTVTIIAYDGTTECGRFTVGQNLPNGVQSTRGQFWIYCLQNDPANNIVGARPGSRITFSINGRPATVEQIRGTHIATARAPIATEPVFESGLSYEVKLSARTEVSTCGLAGPSSLNINARGDYTITTTTGATCTASIGSAAQTLSTTGTTRTFSFTPSTAADSNITASCTAAGVGAVPTSCTPIALNVNPTCTDITVNPSAPTEGQTVTLGTSSSGAASTRFTAGGTAFTGNTYRLASASVTFGATVSDSDPTPDTATCPTKTVTPTLIPSSCALAGNTAGDTNLSINATGNYTITATPGATCTAAIGGTAVTLTNSATTNTRTFTFRPSTAADTTITATCTAAGASTSATCTALPVNVNPTCMDITVNPSAPTEGQTVTLGTSSSGAASTRFTAGGTALTSNTYRLASAPVIFGATVSDSDPAPDTATCPTRTVTPLRVGCPTLTCDPSASNVIASPGTTITVPCHVRGGSNWTRGDFDCGSGGATTSVTFNAAGTDVSCTSDGGLHTISLKNINGLASNECAGPDIFSIPLYTGWNLISLPLTLVNNQPADIFDLLLPLNGVAVAFTYDVDDLSLANPWPNWDRSSPINTLPPIDTRKAYWVLVDDPQTLTISGTRPTWTDIDLLGGWNMFGFKFTNNTTSITSALTGITGEVPPIVMFGYDPRGTNPGQQWPQYDSTSPINTLSGIEAGHGYWINVENPQTWGGIQ